MPRCYLCCPGYPLQGPEQRSLVLERTLALCERLRLDLEASPLLDRFAEAGAWLPVAERIADLQRGWSSELLWAARGGYGCLDLLRALLEQTPPAPRLIGYSDLTVLHACWRRRGWGESYYALMPAAPYAARAVESLSVLLAGDGIALEGDTLPDVRVLRGGSARGPAFAACLSVLAGLVGNPAMPSLDGCVLLIEDIDEAPYRLDRYLHQLHAAGALAGVRGLVGGTFPWQPPAGYAGPTHDDLLGRWCERLELPGLIELPFGHAEDPLSIANGRTVELDCEAAGSWRLAQLAR